MSTNYDRVVDWLQLYVERSGLPRPKIGPALPTDPCDYTSADEIRLNCPKAEDATDQRHAAHVFGHWVCCLHCERDLEGLDIADRVADFIADLLD